MKKILDNGLLEHYIAEHDIEKIFDADILKYAQLHFFKRDEFILEAEDELEYYYLLVSGRIKIHYPFENGKSMILKFYQGFHPVGDLELLKDIPIICNIEATEDCYLIGIPADILRAEYLDNLKLLRHLADSLSEKLYATINNSSYNYVYPLANRLSSYLVQHISGKDYIILNASFEEIAQFLGTTYRHLNRTLKELEAGAIIKCENKTVHILDEERLRELSKNPYIESL